jgi:hypothetical protein
MPAIDGSGGRCTRRFDATALIAVKLPANEALRRRGVWMNILPVTMIGKPHKSGLLKIHQSPITSNL